MVAERLALMYALSMFLFPEIITPSSAWIARTEFARRRVSKNGSARRRAFPSAVERHGPGSSVAMLPLDRVPEMIQRIAANPEEEAAILNDLAGATQDLAILFAPETIILRLAEVVGKSLELASSYLPNSSIRGDNLAFNLPVLATASFLLYRSAVPIIKAQFTELNYRDHVAFEIRDVFSAGGRDVAAV